MRLPWRPRTRHAPTSTDPSYASLQQELHATQDRLAAESAAHEATLAGLQDLNRQFDKATAAADRVHNAMTEELARVRKEAAQLRKQLAEVVGYGTLPPTAWTDTKPATLLERLRVAERRAARATQEAGLARKRGDRLEELLAAAEHRPVRALPDEPARPAPATA